MAITPPTPEQVRAINGTDKTDEEIQPFIDAAMCIVTRAEPCMVGKGLSDECMTTVAAWVAAHLMATSSVGDDSLTKRSENFESYSYVNLRPSSMGNGIVSSSYGQTADDLSGGCLLDATRRSASIGFYGGA